MRLSLFYPCFHRCFHESPAHPATFTAKAVWRTRIMAQTFARPLVGSALAVAHAARVRHMHSRVRHAHALLEYRSARRSVQRAFMARRRIKDSTGPHLVCVGFYCVARFASSFKTACHSAVVRTRLKSRLPKTNATRTVLPGPIIRLPHGALSHGAIIFTQALYWTDPPPVQPARCVFP